MFKAGTLNPDDTVTRAPWCPCSLKVTTINVHHSKAAPYLYDGIWTPRCQARAQGYLNLPLPPRLPPTVSSRFHSAAFTFSSSNSRILRTPISPDKTPQIPHPLPKERSKGEKGPWVRRLLPILFLPVLGRYILYQPGSSSPLSLSFPSLGSGWSSWYHWFEAQSWLAHSPAWTFPVRNGIEKTKETRILRKRATLCVPVPWTKRANSPHTENLT